jgi:hypothetical protein
MIKNNNPPKMAAVIMVFSFCHKKLQLTLPLDACLPVGRGAPLWSIATYSTGERWG